MRRAPDDPGKANGGPRRSFGKALSAGLNIIEALERERVPLSFCDLRARVKVSPVSFARFLRFLKFLVERGYVEQAESGG